MESLVKKSGSKTVRKAVCSTAGPDRAVSRLFPHLRWWRKLRPALGQTATWGCNVPGDELLVASRLDTVWTVSVHKRLPLDHADLLGQSEDEFGEELLRYCSPPGESLAWALASLTGSQRVADWRALQREFPGMAWGVANYYDVSRVKQPRLFQFSSAIAGTMELLGARLTVQIAADLPSWLSGEHPPYAGHVALDVSPHRSLRGWGRVDAKWSAVEAARAARDGLLDLSSAATRLPLDAFRPAAAQNAGGE